MHHNPTVYPDPDAFKPERFLPEQSANRHPYAFIPFSAGPRNCIGKKIDSIQLSRKLITAYYSEIGQKYAIFELKVVLSWVLRKFEFSIADPSGPGIKASSEIVLKPLNGIHLVVKKRQPRSVVV